MVLYPTLRSHQAGRWDVGKALHIAERNRLATLLALSLLTHHIPSISVCGIRQVPGSSLLDM